MPAVQTQLLADESDLAALGPPAIVFGAMSSAQKQAALRAASGEVLSAYAKRYAVTRSTPLAAWGDFTKQLVVDIASYRLMRSRGFNPESKIDQTITKAREDAVVILNEIADLENKNAREDPDVIDSTPGTEEFGVLASSEGGDADEADGWAGRDVSRLMTHDGISGGGIS